MPRPLCAICNNTNATTHLCWKCKQDPANADWREGKEDLYAPSHVAAIIDGRQSDERMSWAEMAERRLSELTELERIIVLLAVREAMPHIKTAARRKIAKEADCSPGYVSDVLDRVFG